MLKSYFVKFLLRIFIFLSAGFLYLTDKNKLQELITTPLYLGISPIHILWVIFMAMMMGHLIPREKLPMGIGKARRNKYLPEENFSEIQLLKFLQNQNVKAWKVMLVWLSFNAIFGILYLLQIMDSIDLIMLSVFYFLCDYICILIFCPFQRWIMKNSCCVNCRIYEWGHFMMFTPMLFIRDFFSWSLFFTSCVVFIKWEITYAAHPERFWKGSNKNLQCRNCKDKTCQIKGKVKE